PARALTTGWPKGGVGPRSGAVAPVARLDRGIEVSPSHPAGPFEAVRGSLRARPVLPYQPARAASLQAGGPRSASVPAGRLVDDPAETGPRLVRQVAQVGETGALSLLSRAGPLCGRPEAGLH